jgi:aldose 1-epimerase
MSALHRPSVEATPFGRLPDGRLVERYMLRGADGVDVGILTYGGIIQSVLAPGRDGTKADVVLGFDTLDGYLTRHPYFGCITGRYANRIADGQFTLDGKTFHLAVNNPPNTLHGGIQGFDRKLWEAQAHKDGDAVGVELKAFSLDGEEGYPGTVRTVVRYTLHPGNALRIEYSATTDAATVINLTNHSYFNLAGEGDILGHEAVIHAKEITAANAVQIPTGELMPVAGTPFDFLAPHRIGERIDAPHPQLQGAGGYDHNYVLRPGRSADPAVAAEAWDPASGRSLRVDTDQPGVQFYTGNSLDGTVTGKSGRAYGRRHGFCFETQHFPDSPNQHTFPSTVLRPGELYGHVCIYTFGVKA